MVESHRLEFYSNTDGWTSWHTAIEKIVLKVITESSLKMCERNNSKWEGERRMLSESM